MAGRPSPQPQGGGRRGAETRGQRSEDRADRSACSCGLSRLGTRPAAGAGGGPGELAGKARAEGPWGRGDRKDQEPRIGRCEGTEWGWGARAKCAGIWGGQRKRGPEGTRKWDRGSREPKGCRNPPGFPPASQEIALDSAVPPSFIAHTLGSTLTLPVHRARVTHLSPPLV